MTVRPTFSFTTSLTLKTWISNYKYKNHPFKIYSKYTGSHAYADTSGLFFARKTSGLSRSSYRLMYCLRNEIDFSSNFNYSDHIKFRHTPYSNIFKFMFSGFFLGRIEKSYDSVPSFAPCLGNLPFYYRNRFLKNNSEMPSILQDTSNKTRTNFSSLLSIWFTKNFPLRKMNITKMQGAPFLTALSIRFKWQILYSLCLKSRTCEWHLIRFLLDTCNQMLYVINVGTLAGQSTL